MGHLAHPSNRSQTESEKPQPKATTDKILDYLQSHAPQALDEFIVLGAEAYVENNLWYFYETRNPLEKIRQQIADLISRMKF